MNTILSIFCITFSLIGCSTLGHTDTQTKKYDPDFNKLIIYSKFNKYDPRPTVILAHGCDGLQNNPNYKRWAEYVDSIGYNVVMYDSYVAMGYSSGNVCELMPGNDQATALWWDKHKSIRPRESNSIAKWVKKQSWHKGKVALLGFSAGGNTAMHYSNKENQDGDDISSVIAFYPACHDSTMGYKTFFKGWILKVPTQVHIGTAEDWSLGDCSNIKNIEMIKYKNATHAFDMDFGRPYIKTAGHIMRYDKEAHEKSKQKVKEFLQANL